MTRQGARNAHDQRASGRRRTPGHRRVLARRQLPVGGADRFDNPLKGLKTLGRSGVLLAKRCYSHYREIVHGPAFASLAEAGVRPQTPLWASTGRKNPAYDDLLYVNSLIGAETINTLPEETIAAFRDHGRPAAALTNGMDEARAHIEALAAHDIDLTEVGEALQIEGVRLFAKAYEKTLSSIRSNAL